MPPRAILAAAKTTGDVSAFLSTMTGRRNWFIPSAAANPQMTAKNTTQTVRMLTAVSPHYSIVPGLVVVPRLEISAALDGGSALDKCALAEPPQDHAPHAATTINPRAIIAANGTNRRRSFRWTTSSTRSLAARCLPMVISCSTRIRVVARPRANAPCHANSPKE
jgi:hypothetical protein